MDVQQSAEHHRPQPFPGDFPQRLKRLGNLAAFSWGESAERLGVSRRRMMRWRHGGKPSGAGLMAVMEVAVATADGWDVILHDVASTPRRDE